MNEEQKTPWVEFARDYQDTWRQIHDANANVPSHTATLVCSPVISCRLFISVQSIHFVGSISLLPDVSGAVGFLRQARVEGVIVDGARGRAVQAGGRQFRSGAGRQ